MWISPITSIIIGPSLNVDNSLQEDNMFFWLLLLPPFRLNSLKSNWASLKNSANSEGCLFKSWMCSFLQFLLMKLHNSAKSIPWLLFSQNINFAWGIWNSWMHESCLHWRGIIFLVVRIIRLLLCQWPSFKDASANQIKSWSAQDFFNQIGP